MLLLGGLRAQSGLWMLDTREPVAGRDHSLCLSSTGERAGRPNRVFSCLVLGPLSRAEYGVV